MSQYVTKLRARDGIQWPTPVGTWQQEEDINRLDMFANNLDVSQGTTDTDLLNSVPTPWARLLLFESALYKTSHPSHRDVEDQWRGLLGVLALADPLQLKLTVSPFRLGDYQGSTIGRSFAALRPYYHVNTHDEEKNKWNDFQMILVDGAVLGATSPRTLVFTGIAHECPPSVPFRTITGRLMDPALYYRRFNDQYFLGVLAYWVGGLITTLGQNPHLAAWMGSVPAARGAGSQQRLSLLLERLRAWRAELQNVQPISVDGQPVPRFTLAPYNNINGIPRSQGGGESDLFLKGSRDVMVCYREPHAKLLTANGHELMSEQIKIYDGRWVQSNQPLPLPFNFLPPHISVIEDPLALFEDTLIKVNLPQNPETVHTLQIGDERSANTYLYPFKQEILRYLRPHDIAENTKISINQITNKPRVELSIPLENNRVIRVAREYDIDAGAVIVNAPTAGLAMWPDFVSPMWHRYFYIKASVSPHEVNFEPTVPASARSKENHTWYVTSKAVSAFVGSVNNKRGLLLLRHNEVESPDKFWKVGIDFGSTHTRAYSLEVDRRDERYVPSPGANISPVTFTTRARHLTFIPAASLEDSFLALVGEVDPPERRELKTLLMMPETNPGDVEGWLPREGYVYTHWLFNGDYNATHLRHDLKWNGNREDPDLRAYLRCLLLMIQAEALRQRARVISISHTYPSVFTAGLVAKHMAEWRGLDQYINSGTSDDDPKVEIEDATITETVAVCRHLEWEQHASPVENTISLDVGGSTTDVAVWAKKQLNVQESVKLASGIVGLYLQSADARQFMAWLETTLHGAPYNLKSFSLANFADKSAGYGLMFNNVLSLIEWHGQLDVLIKQINGAEESKPLMSHIIYLYGGLLYYAGLLARKAGLPKEQSSYHLYFCGKGGTLLRWVRGYQELVQQMFAAGLFGPNGRGQNVLPEVEVKISAMPKEEVGRGLLAESKLEGKQREEIGLVDTRPPTVTVGETGYHGLAWDGELDSSVLLHLPKNVVPPVKDLRELSTFREAFRTSKATEAASRVLKLDSVSDSKFQSHLLQRLFGSAKGSIIDDVQDRPKDALLEPLFITEIKVLLETSTDNAKLFN